MRRRASNYSRPTILYIVISLVLSASLCSAGSIQEAQFTVADVINALKDREDAFTSFRMDVSFEIDDLPVYYIDKDHSKIQHFSQRIKYLFDKTGRYRIEVQGSELYGDDLAQTKLIGVDDGEETSWISGSTDFVSGTVSGTSKVPVRIDGRELLTWHTGRSISRQLEKRGCNLETVDTIGDSEVISVSTDVVVDEDCSNRTRFYLDPSRHFAVVQAIDERRLHGETQPWQTYVAIRYLDYERVDDVAWVPKRVEYEWVTNSLDGKAEPRTIRSWVAVVEDFQFNPDVVDEDFEIDYPDKVFVHDERTGQHFVVKRLDDETIQRQIVTADGVLTVTEDTGWNRPVVWLVVVNVVFLVVVSSVIFLRRR